MKKTIVVAGIAAVLLLSGCTQQQYDADTAYAKHQAHLAKLCREADGVYRYDWANGYYCDYSKAAHG